MAKRMREGKRVNRYGSNNIKVTQEMADKIGQKMEDQPRITVLKMSMWMRETYPDGEMPSMSSIRRVMKKTHTAVRRWRCQDISPVNKDLRRRFCTTLLRRIMASRGVRRHVATMNQAAQHDPVWIRRGEGKTTAAKRGVKDLLKTTAQGSHGWMVGALLSGSHGLSRMYVLPSGIKINAEAYIDTLEGDYWPQLLQWYPDSTWVWQEDNAPAHVAKKTKEWYDRNWSGAGDSPPIERLFWPPQSPDLSPLDFGVWSEIASKLPQCRNTKEGRALLRASVDEVVANIDQEAMKKLVCETFEKRLRACLKADGGHFEHLL